MTTPDAQAISQAKLDWQIDDTGRLVPVSMQFGDVYFSSSDGLAETNYVFLQHNQLAKRLVALQDFERFVIGEIGFGTGLNMLATWQLWNQVKPSNHSHLHLITTEKFPLSKADLTKALAIWPSLQPLSEQLLANYPPPLAGCHRLHFWADRLTLDIWLGDATTSLSQITGQGAVNAWFLDGFAPSCNDAMWSATLFRQLRRLSAQGTTLATFSVASQVKQGLSQHGFSIKKVKGFGKKREMLTACLIQTTQLTPPYNHYSFRPLTPTSSISYAKPPYHQTFSNKSQRYIPKHPRPKRPVKLPDFVLPDLEKIHTALSIGVIGAGVAGLSCAYALAMRGHQVTIYDKSVPLAGASGNPRAVLAPKLTSLARMPSNLHAIGYLASCRYYRALGEQTSLPILQTTGCLDLLAHNRVSRSDVQAFPPEFAQLLTAEQAQDLAGIDVDIGECIFIPEAGLIDTQLFAQAVLSHPNIHYQQGRLVAWQQSQTHIDFNIEQHAQTVTKTCDHLILATALDTNQFLPQLKPFNYSRGQVSWLALDENNQTALPTLPLKYGGYLAKFVEQGKPALMLGASFVRDTLDTSTRLIDHESNITEALTALPSFTSLIRLLTTHPPATWQGRASLRSQTVDYLPLAGQVWPPSANLTKANLPSSNKTTANSQITFTAVAPQSRLWTFCALGSKGYAYAPIASELIAGLICGELLPLSQHMVSKLSPNRHVLRAKFASA